MLRAFTPAAGAPAPAPRPFGQTKSETLCLSTLHLPITYLSPHLSVDTATSACTSISIQQRRVRSSFNSWTWGELKVQVHSLACDYPVLSAPFVSKGRFFLPLEWSSFLVKNQTTDTLAFF